MCDERQALQVVIQEAQLLQR